MKNLQCPQPIRPTHTDGGSGSGPQSCRSSPHGLLLGSFLRSNTDVAAVPPIRLCQNRNGVGERSRAASVVGRIGRVGHDESVHALVRRVAPFHPLSCCSRLLGGRRPPVSGECPPPAERSGGCREPAVEVAVCGRAGWYGAGRRQETCEDKFPAAGLDRRRQNMGGMMSRGLKVLFYLIFSKFLVSTDRPFNANQNRSYKILM